MTTFVQFFRNVLLVPMPLLLLVPQFLCAAEDVTAQSGEIFATDNLVAWCIVPFDAKQRSPAERAQMLKRLGITKVAFDWRAEHVPIFEEEIVQYKQHGLEYFAFWDWHEAMEPLVRKHKIRPQIWKTSPSPNAGSHEARVKAAAAELLPLVEKARRLGCKFGLYNHGGWGGEPENLVAVCEYLRQHHAAEHVGIVYNFHHAHDVIDRFSDALRLMQPYLLCININGMADPETVAGLQNTIVTLGQGQHEQSMLKAILESGYEGPIGILDHRSELDAEESLRANLAGLAMLRQRLGQND